MELVNISVYSSQFNGASLRNPTVRYRHQLNPPLDLILIQCSALHVSEIRFEIVLPSTSPSAKWSLSIRFPNQNCVRNSCFPIRATAGFRQSYVEVTSQ